MRRDLPSRHGRAADATIAAYLRELLAEDELDPLAVDAAAEPEPGVPPAVLEMTRPQGATLDAVR